ncbi:hypothetical protein [Actinomadura sp. 6N118]|uniref:hypothetical protein n=1 Tax=Actinomadura sp. 6N118 TaxID=3375151 RepID=UPI003795756B
MRTFEDRLLAELRTIVAERTPVPARRTKMKEKGLRLGLAACAVTAAAAGVVAIPAFNGERAYGANTVVREPDGSIKLTLVDFSHPERVEAKLRSFGVPAKVDFLPFGTQCRGREHDSDFWNLDGPDNGVFGGDPATDPHADQDMRGSVIARVHPNKLRPGEQVLLSVWYDPSAGRDSAIAFSPLVKKTDGFPPCQRVPGGPTNGPDGVGG